MKSLIKIRIKHLFVILAAAAGARAAQRLVQRVSNERSLISYEIGHYRS